MVTFSKAFTTPADNTNLIEGDPISISSRWRKLMKVGFIGGAAIGDGHLQVFIGSKIVVDMRNPIDTDIFTDQYIFPVGGEFIPPRTPVSAVLVDGTGADNYSLYLDIKDM